MLSRRITDLTFTAGAAIGIAAAAYIASDVNLSDRLRKVTTILYLYITMCLFIHTTILVYQEKEALSESSGGNSEPASLNTFHVSPGLGLRQRTTVGQTYGVFFLCPILLLLLIRQAYLLATFSSFKDRQNNENLWYPLFALPEFLAACLFSVPGLVPHPGDSESEDKRQSYWSRLWSAYNTNT